MAAVSALSPARRVAVAAFALLLALGPTGCATGVRTLVMRADARANQGRNFYLLVRTVAEKDFFIDGYQKIVGMVFPVSKDPSIKLVQLIRPGKVERAQIKVADGESFAVYALFTQPGDPWKVLISPPLQKEYELRLADSRIILERQGQ